MRQISKWPFPTGAAVLLATLLLGLFTVQPARADDPSITNGYSTTLLDTNGGSESSLSWTYTNTGALTDGIVSFYNGTGTAWTTLEILANYDTAGHTFTAYVSPNTSGLAPGATEVFNSGSAVITSSDLATFNFSGGTAVASGDYLVFDFTNWNTNYGPAPTSFEFGANGATPGEDPPPVPEPGTIMLLGAGLFGLAIFVKRHKYNC